ncbi:sulfite exporter TauE/SafE family protein [Anaerocolumna sp. AGMB13020]|uniref:urease accessory protein UreH domain-containing protein n=1 Tax=Anaerocolumna sp. AGMB13020 TaxID=3081750 RepID=UPI00295424E9|nr:sulfite exporter TauE/SafE family protein [Anaerocolumna sp. AGMB13020]WOO34692.1 sulfite exporter TauE/SafE family protein [Anaerocolumna sp. AGMB13020]
MESTTIHGVLMVEGLKEEDGAKRIEKSLKKHKGVIQAKALLDSSNVYLTYKVEEVSLEELAGVVEALGFQVMNKPAGKRAVQTTQAGNSSSGDSNRVTVVLAIEGMSCGACEMKIEDRLNELEGIEKAKVSYKNANALITYQPKKISQKTIEAEIEKLDYHIGTKENKKAREDKTSISQLLGIGIILLAVFMLQKNTGLFQLVPQINQNMGYGLLFLIGIITSLHCVAMCGGINLSQCVNYGGGESSGTGLTKFKPGILYNGGRVVSYTLIGGIVGALGSVISLSGSARGLVAVVAGVFMVIMGLNMLNIFPALKKIVPRMPKVFRRKLAVSGKSRGPFYIGLLNGLMPCGPLQSMQLYALGTGSFFGGALSMFLFSLGTVPLMFGFGAVAGILNSKYTKKMMKVSAALVMALGVIMLNRGLSLSGIDLVRASGTQEAGNTAKVEAEVQSVTTKLQPGGYEPIVVQKGIPVKWTIQAEKKDINGCNETIIIPAYNIEVTLTEGDNLVEFTPDKSGTVAYSCWMGMIRSSIRVVDDIKDKTAVTAADDTAGQDTASGDSDNGAGGSSGSTSSGLIGNNTSGALSGCCQAPPEGFEDGKIPTDDIAVAKVEDNKQEVTVTVDNNGYSPAVVVLQRGVEAKIKFDGKELNGCNYLVVFPEYQGQLDLTQQTETPWLTITEDFTFQCSMSMLHGYVKVVDDINNINLDEIRNEIDNYTPSDSSLGGCCGPTE